MKRAEAIKWTLIVVGSLIGLYLLFKLVTGAGQSLQDGMKRFGDWFSNLFDFQNVSDKTYDALFGSETPVGLPGFSADGGTYTTPDGVSIATNTDYVSGPDYAKLIGTFP